VTATTSMSDTETAATLATIRRFNEAFNRHDVNAVMTLMTDDVVFENTSPAPNGERCVGQAAVRAFWEGFFRASPHAAFEAEDVFAVGDRGVVQWTYRWRHDDGTAGHVRGVDLFRVHDGKVAEKLSYVKG
jgi:ketosteroid isomerase-like protein